MFQAGDFPLPLWFQAFFFRTRKYTAIPATARIATAAIATIRMGNSSPPEGSVNAPSAQNDKAEIRKLEPYCYGQFTEGKDSPFHGRSHVHWLTGTASTVMVGSVEGILGMRPDFYGLKIAPSIPSKWDELSITKTFRGKKLNITIKNPGHAESGFKSMTLNGEAMDSPYIPAEMMKDENEVVLYIS